MTYVHRIGRTGRGVAAGETDQLGRCFTFFSEEDSALLKSIAVVASASGAEIPAWMLHLGTTDRRKLKQLERRPPVTKQSRQTAKQVAKKAKSSRKKTFIEGKKS